jgi:hypothetical protein
MIPNRQIRPGALGGADADGIMADEEVSMSALTVNDQMAAILTTVQTPTELRDASGKLIGVFHPRTIGHTTREVFEHLRTLTTDPERLADLYRHIEELTRRDEEA